MGAGDSVAARKFHGLLALGSAGDVPVHDLADLDSRGLETKQSRCY